MRFVHITDTHIGPTPQYKATGQRPYPILEALVKEINCLPFEPDFILHTGDVVDDAGANSYQLARPLLQQLKAPVFYAVGNHDLPQPLQQALLGKRMVSDRYDYYVKVHGIGLAIFDSHKSNAAEGTLTPEQIEALRDLCQPKGPPLIIALHHQPVLLDVQWLDHGWKHYHMMLECGDAFLEAILPARNRIRGVFFGHVHRSFQVVKSGILFSAAASACAQILSWPLDPEPLPSPDELPSFNIVTITADSTVVRQHTFPRPY
jgi:Icc protein